MKLCINHVPPSKPRPGPVFSKTFVGTGNVTMTGPTRFDVMSALASGR